jgi:alkyl hydroperoxide reductase subunit AhpF
MMTLGLHYSSPNDIESVSALSTYDVEVMNSQRAESLVRGDLIEVKLGERAKASLSAFDHQIRQPKTVAA